MYKYIYLFELAIVGIRPLPAALFVVVRTDSSITPRLFYVSYTTE